MNLDDFDEFIPCEKCKEAFEYLQYKILKLTDWCEFNDAKIAQLKLENIKAVEKVIEIAGKKI